MVRAVMGGDKSECWVISVGCGSRRVLIRDLGNIQSVKRYIVIGNTSFVRPEVVRKYLYLKETQVKDRLMSQIIYSGCWSKEMLFVRRTIFFSCDAIKNDKICFVFEI